MAVAQLALPQRPALNVGESGEYGAASLALAHAAARGVAAGEQLNLLGNALFFLKARVVGRDALRPFHQIFHYMLRSRFLRSIKEFRQMRWIGFTFLLSAEGFPR
jgi:hypothetical protein